MGRASRFRTNTAIAVIQMSRSLALDHAKEGIRVNTICPGFIKTKMNEDFICKHPV